MKKTLAAFDQGQIPTIAVVNQASTPLGLPAGKTLADLVAAMQKFVDVAFAPIWGTPCRLVVSSKIAAGQWAIVLLDDADQAGALGYHDLTPDGFPLSKVFVRTTIKAGDKVSVTACHELAEMLVDPGIQLIAEGPSGVFYAYETCDAVENDEFPIDGIAMSNFVTPAWFEGFRKAKSARFDWLKLCTKPFQIRPGGYMPIFKAGRGAGWTQVFGRSSRFGKRPRLRVSQRGNVGTTRSHKRHAGSKR